MSAVPPSPAPNHATERARERDVTSVRAALRSPRRLRTEVLAGLVVALALIPEAISFSIIAGVDPQPRRLPLTSDSEAGAASLSESCSWLDPHLLGQRAHICRAFAGHPAWLGNRLLTVVATLF